MAFPVVGFRGFRVYVVYGATVRNSLVNRLPLNPKPSTLNPKSQTLNPT